MYKFNKKLLIFACIFASLSFVLFFNLNMFQEKTLLESNKETTNIPVDKIKESKNKEVKNILEKANQGDVIAELTIGLMYFCNDDNPKDYHEYFTQQVFETARRWEPKCRDENNSDNVTNILRISDLNNLRNSKYIEESVKWISIASEKGNDYAELTLASLYWNGYGVTKNDELAISLYKKSAEQGNVISQLILAEIYGTKPNGEEESIKFYNLCAENGNSTCQDWLGDLFYRKEKYSDAFKWYSLAANNGSTSSQNHLAVMYFKGHGVIKNVQESAKLFKKSADSGDLDAEYIVGLMYFRGDGFQKNHQEASKYFTKVAEELEKQESDKLFELKDYYGSIKKNASFQNEYENDYKQKIENVKTVALFYRSLLYRSMIGLGMDDYILYSTQARITPEFYLGVIYLSGEGVLQNYEQSAKWFRIAAFSDDNDTTSQYNLALMYVKGMGLPKNLLLAHMWSNIASSSGDVQASELRDNIENIISPEQISQAQNMAAKCKSSSFLECE